MIRPLPFAHRVACLIAVCCLAVALPLPATGAGPDPAGTPLAAPAALTGDAGKGRRLAVTCQGCHGVTGYRNPYPGFRVPKITGQSPEYLIQAMNAYKHGQRRHATMQAQAQGLSDQDIADLAAYLARPGSRP